MEEYGEDEEQDMHSENLKREDSSDQPMASYHEPISPSESSDSNSEKKKNFSSDEEIEEESTPIDVTVSS